jgi:hypothetical protein
MPAINIDRRLSDFEDTVDDALNFLFDSLEFYRIGPNNRPYRIHVREKELLAGLCLFRIYLAWEEFLEGTFCRYMCGAQTSSGYAPGLVGPRESTINSAILTILSGRSYLTWGENATRNRASSVFLNGDPYATAISAISGKLKEIVTVRNRIAHRSDFAKQEFRNTVIIYRGYVPTGYSPGRFLLDHGLPGIPGNDRVIKFYADNLLGAAQIIVR